jgi:hypothetical protein
MTPPSAIAQAEMMTLLLPLIQERKCDTPIKRTRANNVLKYQFLDQSLVQYIIEVVHSHTTLLFKYKTLQH